MAALAGQFNKLGDGSELIALRASAFDGADSFNASFDSQIGAAQSAVAVDPMSSLANAFSGARPDGQNPQSQPQDNMRDLQNQFTATVNDSKIWKPTDKLNNNQVAQGVESNRAEGAIKSDIASTSMDEIRGKTDDLKQRMDALESNGPSVGPAGPDPSRGGGFGGAAMREIGGSFATAAVSAVNPVAGAAMGVALMVSAMGRGSFGVQNTGEFTRPSVDSKGRIMDSAYGRSESAPQPQQQQGPAAPVSQNFLNTMSAGPGFGRAALKPDMDDGRVGLTGDGLRDVRKINIEDTPAMQAYNSMRLDGVNVTRLHEARMQNGVTADAGNLARAENMGVKLDDRALTQPQAQAPRLNGGMM